MPSINFTGGVVISSNWLNDLNTVAFTYFGDGSNLNSPTKIQVAQGVFSTSVITPLVDATGVLLLRSGGAGALQFSSASGVVSCNSDNTTTLGSSALRWSALFTPIIDSGTTGSLSFRTSNGTTQFIVDHTAGTVVNVLHATGGVSGSPPFLQALGDANIGMRLIASGTGSIVFEAPGGTTQFVVLGTAGATRSITVTGSNGGNPTIAATAGSPAIVYASAGGTGTPTNHTLAMYEEGTWTPSVGGSATYTTQLGSYTKIGRLVFVKGTIVINAIGTGSSTQISGFPFTNATDFGTNITIEVIANAATAIVSATGLLNANSTTMDIRSRTAANAGDGGSGIFQSGTQVSFAGCYNT